MQLRYTLVKMSSTPVVEMEKYTSQLFPLIVALVVPMGNTLLVHCPIMGMYRLFYSNTSILISVVACMSVLIINYDIAWNLRKGVCSLAFDSKGVLLISGSEDGIIRVWDIQTSNIVRILKHSKGTFLIIKNSW